jgi:hypothetical protein
MAVITAISTASSVHYGSSIAHPTNIIIFVLHPFKYNIQPEPQEEHITGLVHTIIPDAELLAPAPLTIHHTIENLSIQTIQQFTTQQIPQENDVESLETIRQFIERFSLPPFTGYRESENLYDSGSERDNTTCHIVVCFAIDPFISRCPNNFNRPIYFYRTLEYGSLCNSTYDII